MTRDELNALEIYIGDIETKVKKSACRINIDVQLNGIKRIIEMNRKQP